MVQTIIICYVCAKTNGVRPEFHSYSGWPFGESANLGATAMSPISAVSEAPPSDRRVELQISAPLFNVKCVPSERYEWKKVNKTAILNTLYGSYLKWQMFLSLCFDHATMASVVNTASYVVHSAYTVSLMCVLYKGRDFILCTSCITKKRVLFCSNPIF